MVFFDSYEHLIGVSLALIASVFSALANVLIKKNHLKWKDVPEDERPSSCRDPMWFLIIFLYIGNAVLDFAAFAFAPLSLVAPTSAMTIVSNAYLAKFYFGEELSTQDKFGTCLAVLGAVGSIAVGSRQEANRDLDDLIALYKRYPFLIYTFVHVSLIVCSLLYVLSTTGEKSNEEVARLDKTRRSSNDHHINTMLQEHSLSSDEDASRRHTEGEDSSESAKSSGSGRKKRGNKIAEDDIDIGTVRVEDAASGSSASAQLKRVHEREQRGKRQQHTQASSSSLSATSEAPPKHTQSFSRISQRTSQIVHALAHSIVAVVNKTKSKAVAAAFLTSGLGSWTNLFGKSAVELLKHTITGDNQFFNVVAWVLVAATIICAILQLKAMSRMMETFEAVLIVPIYQCFFILQLIIAGFVYFDEISTLTQTNLIIFACCIFVCFVGIYILAQRAAKVADAQDALELESQMGEAPAAVKEEEIELNDYDSYV